MHATHGKSTSQIVSLVGPNNHNGHARTIRTAGGLEDGAVDAVGRSEQAEMCVTRDGGNCGLSFCTATNFILEETATALGKPAVCSCFKSPRLLLPASRYCGRRYLLSFFDRYVSHFSPEKIYS